MSLRKASVAVGISITLARNILVEELKLKPYKIQDAQKLDPPDYEKRVKFAEMFLLFPKSANFFLYAVMKHIFA